MGRLQATMSVVTTDTTSRACGWPRLSIVSTSRAMRPGLTGASRLS